MKEKSFTERRYEQMSLEEIDSLIEYHESMMRYHRRRAIIWLSLSFVCFGFTVWSFLWW